MISPDQLKTLWPEYRQNLLRQLCAVGEFTDRAVKAEMIKRGYDNLDLNLIQPLSLLSVGMYRPSELAQTLNISQQYCSKLLGTMSHAGFISRSVDSRDGRAVCIQLTPLGRRLIDDGLAELKHIGCDYAAVLGTRRQIRLATLLQRIGSSFTVPGLRRSMHLASTSPHVAVALGALAREAQWRMLQLIADRGHAGLQISYGQVLHNIDLDGTPVSQLAEQNGVTTQAIARIARRLEALGYINRYPQRVDRRSVCIAYTPKGMQLLVDTVASMRILEQELAAAIGTRNLEDFKRLVTMLYEGLPIRDELLKPHSAGVASPDQTCVKQSLTRVDILAYVAALLDSDGAVPAGTDTQCRVLGAVVPGAGSLSMAEIEAALNHRLGRRALNAAKSNIRQLAAAVSS